jgi:uncharacterized membrane protein
VNARLATGFQVGRRWGAVLLVGIGYSVLAYLAAATTTPDSLDALVAVAPLVGVAFAIAWRSSQRTIMLTLWLASCAALYGASTWWVTYCSWVILLQHSGLYALLCVAFGSTLRSGRTPMVTSLAGFVHSTISPALIEYTRSVTWAWSIYFGCISGLSMLLFWLAPVAIWSAFANLLDFPLLALMFVGEYAVRCYVLPAEDRAGPLDAIRAYRRASSGGTTRQP